MKNNITGKDDKFTVDEISQIVNNVARRYDIKKVVLYGSYARETATELSDIDLLVFGGETLSSLEFFAFCGRLYKVSDKFKDIFDFESLRPDSVWVTEIEREGITIYGH